MKIKWFEKSAAWISLDWLSTFVDHCTQIKTDITSSVPVLLIVFIILLSVRLHGFDPFELPTIPLRAKWMEM